MYYDNHRERVNTRGRHTNDSRAQKIGHKINKQHDEETDYTQNRRLDINKNTNKHTQKHIKYETGQIQNN